MYPYTNNLPDLPKTYFPYSNSHVHQLYTGNS